MEKKAMRKTVIAILTLAIAMGTIGENFTNKNVAFAEERSDYAVDTIVNLDNNLVVEDGVVMECKNKQITEVNLSNDIIGIASDAFAECINLKKVTMTNSVEFIGDNAFSVCPSLETVVLSGKLHDTEKIFGDYYSEHYNYKGIDVSFAEIDENSEENEQILEFECHTPQIKSISVPDGYFALDFDLSECINLKSVTMTNSVEHLSPFAFAVCPSLETVVLSGKLHDTSDIFGDYYSEHFNYKGVDVSFAEIDFTVNKDITDNILRFECHTPQIKSISVPDGYFALNFNLIGCTNLETITMTNSVEHLGIMDFGNCPNFKNIKISNKALQNVSNIVSHGEKIIGVSYDDMVKGDCNADGNVSVSDLVTLTSYMLSDKIEYISTGSDVNDDGVINVFDMIYLKSMLLS